MIQFSNKKGFTLVDVLVGTFLLLLVFLGIFGAYRLGLKVVGQSKNRNVAISIAEGEMEKIRSLPYTDVGVVGDFPDGVLQQTEIKTINGVDYTIETRVDYVVDSADGLSPPGDSCPNDYKKVKIKVSWSGLLGGEVEFSMDVSPETLAQECAETGGILLVSVFDAFGMPVASPLIEIKDPQTDEVLKTASPVDGEHYFSLAPNAYKIVVSKANYSTDSTYGIGEVASPEKPHPIVLDGQLTEISFSIDKTSSFSIDTLSGWSMDYFSDSFSGTSRVSDFVDMEIGAGQAILATETKSRYETSGHLVSIDISPENLLNWEEFSWTDQEPAGTQISYQVLYFDGFSWSLIPDIDLTGNSAGFTSSPVDLSGLDPSVYFQLRIKADFSTIDPASTPVLFDWQVSWKNSGTVPISNVQFHLRGEKIIGKDFEESSVYKYSEEHNSGAGGHIDISGLEWDVYTFSIDPSAGLDLAEIDPAPQPIALSPDTNLGVVLYLEAQNSLLLTVQDKDTGEPIFSAECRLHKSGIGYDVTQYTDEEGKTYFIPLEATNYYSLEVQATGYSSFSGLVSISGDETKIVSLERIE